MERNAASATPVDSMQDGESITDDSSSPLRSDEKVQSRYLSPRVASCHDFCKYGHKHESEVEARRLNFRKFLKNKKKSARNVEHNEVTIVIAGERRTKQKAASNMEYEFPDDAEVSKPQTPPPSKNSLKSGGKQTPQATLANEQGIKPKSTSNVEVEKSQTPSPIKNDTISNGKKALQTSFENEQGTSDVKKVKANKGRTLGTTVQSKPSPASDMEAPVEKKTKSLVWKPVSPVAPKVSQQKASPLVAEAQKLKPVVPSPPKKADVSRKPAIALKTKTPLIRSLSQRKSSKIVIARSSQENTIMRSHTASRNSVSELSEPSVVSSFSKPSRNLIDRDQNNKIIKGLATSKTVERKQLKPTPSSFMSKTQDNGSSFQLRKLRSIKRTLTPHDNVFSTQFRRLRSTKKSSTPHDAVSSLQPRKLRSVQPTLTPHDNVSTLAPGKLRSVRRTSAPRETVSVVQTRKLWSTKQTTTFRDIVSRFQPKKLRSMKRSSSRKNEEEASKADTESKSENDGLVPDTKTGESEFAIHGDNDKETEYNDSNAVVSENNTKKSRRNATVPPRPEDNASTPFMLKFRRGKVINLRSDSIGARRLWFNIGRLASENTNGSGMQWRRSLKKKSSTSFDSEDPDSKVHSVVLKHQGVAEKKDSKSLFNHVIEETASKLVETRKSKVKALVGAFETVISLQETKPASTA